MKDSYIAWARYMWEGRVGLRGVGGGSLPHSPIPPPLFLPQSHILQPPTFHTIPLPFSVQIPFHLLTDHLTILSPLPDRAKQIPEPRLDTSTNTSTSSHMKFPQIRSPIVSTVVTLVSTRHHKFRLQFQWKPRQTFSLFDAFRQPIFPCVFRRFKAFTQHRRTRQRNLVLFTCALSFPLLLPLVLSASLTPPQMSLPPLHSLFHLRITA